MSLIPSNGISAALTPIQRQTHDAIQARKMQLQKNLHHAQDIQELEEAGVDAIHDQDQREDQQEQPQKDSRGEDQVDIQALEPPVQQPPRPSPATPPPSRLDISA